MTDASVAGNTLFLVSHKDAPRFKVLRLPLSAPDITKADVVVPPAESVVTGVAAASDALYVRRMNGGISELLRLALDGDGPARAIKLPYDGDIDALAADPRVPGLLFGMGGWTRFGSVFAYTPKSGRVVDTGLQPQGPYDNPRDLVSEEVKATAADGTEIPLSIVYKKGIKRDSGNPTDCVGIRCVRYFADAVVFTPTLLPWYERGGIFAVAHVRGGGEYGEDWYKAGFQATKPNTWRDAIACARWLVDHRYSSPAKLSVRGGSAGGILVGRAITERPDLFAAAIDDVPVSDSLRMEFSANGVPNIPEFGSVTTEAGFKALLEMSPYAHVKDGVAYPAVLLTTGFNDPRVDAWEAAKMAARLQAASSSGRPILLRVDYGRRTRLRHDQEIGVPARRRPLRIPALAARCGRLSAASMMTASEGRPRRCHQTVISCRHTSARSYGGGINGAQVDANRGRRDGFMWWNPCGRGRHYRRGRDVPLPDLREMGRGLQDPNRRRHELPVDRIRRRHRPDQGEDGRFRRVRHAAEGRRPAGRGLMQFPAIIGGVVPVVNLRGHRARRDQAHRPSAGRHLPRQDQEVERQGDRRAERRLKLPDEAITVVRRSDGSGTTFIWTDYLSKVESRVEDARSARAPRWRGRKASAARATKAWPRTCSASRASIGYVEYAYAKQNRMTHASVQNHDGQFVQPDDATFQGRRRQRRLEKRARLLPDPHRPAGQGRRGRSPARASS